MSRKILQQLREVLITANILAAIFLIGPTMIHAATPADFGLTEGDLISASGSNDPDIYIVNEYGYKRLFLNPTIFNFYGHLKWSNVRSVTATTRDVFSTSGLFRNCEANDPKVYGVEIIGEDVGTFHWVNVSAAQALTEDTNFFQKVFCINTSEFNWYPKSLVDYTSLAQVPEYSRISPISEPPTQETIEYKLPPSIPQQPDTSKDGPWNRDLLKAESSDGTTFGASSIFVLTAGVPSVTKDVQGRLVAAFQWFPENNTDNFDQIAIAISEDNGVTWASPQPMKIANFPQGYQRPFDPTVVTIANGKIRMYFTAQATGQTKPSIYSAISDDGINYIFEGDQRFGVSNETVLDSAVGFLNGTWHMINPYNVQGVMGTAYHAVSADGLSFTRQANLSFPQTVSWIGNLIGFGNGLRFYGSASPQIWWTFTQDGASWSQPTMTNVTGGDPAVVKLSDGRYVMIYVGPPKEPLPSAQQPPD